MIYFTVRVPVAITQTHFIWTVTIYITAERIKYQLSVYDKMPMLNFSNASVTFQFSFCPIREGWFEI